MPSVELIEYQNAWPVAFRAVCADLSSVMAGPSVTVEHIGSTSVPGLCSKAVIDVLVGIDDLNEVQDHVDELRERGYQYRPEYERQIPQRRYFVKAATGAIPRVHVHAVVHDGPLWRDHIAFRNALREDTGLRDRYAKLKRELAGSLSKSAYTEAKGPFIRGALESAASGKAQSAA